MDNKRVIEVKKNILAANDEAADAFRAARVADGTFFVDVMASPGAGKTTILLAIIKELRSRGVQELGVIEADLESDVDALKIKEAGVESVELNTRGVCHVEMGMVEAAFQAFGGERFDYLFLENIGNLVCPADFDTGAHTRVMLLSVPEGWDKVMKYPPMFAAVDALIVTKCDYLPLNEDFDMDRLKEEARRLNPTLNIFITSARTHEGVPELVDWLQAQRAEKLGL
ncbi:hydrogenase nickel incorporation protein HypB [Adlercreutzia sp. R21]|uniref:hydrogenase nickel incorporation protein HypB n=1 Tax=Adlercreutzia wanghongyangiae TaxID=3111451 RepID=UPI002DBF96C1|nr:hydrogenase nickel incorporation protein HypB [Adlercreutzia sp. R21]MEC4185133.1 hydrogenase nickel incorporation protein HypB [Adlercreutzia sp. R21]